MNNEKRPNILESTLSFLLFELGFFTILAGITYAASFTVEFPIQFINMAVLVYLISFALRICFISAK